MDVCFCKRFTGGAGDHLAARGMSSCAFGTCQGTGSTAGSTAGSVSAAQSGCKSGAAQHSESVIRSVFISHLISFLNHGHLSGFDHFFTLRSDLLEHLEETEVLRETILK